MKSLESEIVMESAPKVVMICYARLSPHGRPATGPLSPRAWVWTQLFDLVISVGMAIISASWTAVTRIGSGSL
jgi:hypothetical protein